MLRKTVGDDAGLGMMAGSDAAHEIAGGYAAHEMAGGDAANDGGV